MPVIAEMPGREDWQALILLQGDAPTSTLIFPGINGELITLDGEKNWRTRPRGGSRR